MNLDRKYKFSWDLLGDIQAGRPNMGNMTRLEVYRLMQFTFRDIMEQRFGQDVADGIFYDAGKLAGLEFYKNVIGQVANYDEFLKKLQLALQEMGIGILRVEKADLDEGKVVLTVSEDLDCSGLPELDFEICKYDEGFISGLLEGFSGNSFDVKEVDCWCTGDRTCRFAAQKI
jgi:uncharacterized protein